MVVDAISIILVKPAQSSMLPLTLLASPLKLYLGVVVELVEANKLHLVVLEHGRHLQHVARVLALVPGRCQSRAGGCALVMMHAGGRKGDSAQAPSHLKLVQSALENYYFSNSKDYV